MEAINRNLTIKLILQVATEKQQVAGQAATDTFCGKLQPTDGGAGDRNARGDRTVVCTILLHLEPTNLLPTGNISLPSSLPRGATEQQSYFLPPPRCLLHPIGNSTAKVPFQHFKYCCLDTQPEAQ